MAFFIPCVSSHLTHFLPLPHRRYHCLGAGLGSITYGNLASMFLNIPTAKPTAAPSGPSRKPTTAPSLRPSPAPTAVPSASGAINSGYMYGIAYSDSTCASVDTMFVYPIGVCIKASGIKLANYKAFPALGYFNISYWSFADFSCTTYDPSSSSVFSIPFGSCAAGGVYGYSATPPTVPRAAGVIQA